jgi:hypothetical protein
MPCFFKYTVMEPIIWTYVVISSKYKWINPYVTNPAYCHIVCVCDYRQGLDWWMDLLTTYTHNPQLQAVTVAPPISTIPNHNSTC